MANMLAHDFAHPQVERFRGGVLFRNKPYFPAYCSNGVDGMLIDLHGSGNATWDEYDFSAAGTQFAAKGWHKMTWRNRADSTLPYGRLVPVVEFAMRAVLHGDLVSPVDVRQYLDARRGVIHSRLIFADAESDTPLALRVDTTLLRRGLLLEHVHILAAPAGLTLRYRLNAPSHGYLEMSRRFDIVLAEACDVEKALPYLRLQWEGRSAIACSWLLDHPWQSTTCGEQRGANVWMDQQSPPLVAGRRITRCVAVLEGDDPRMAHRLVAATRAMSYAKLRRHHRRHVARPKARRLARVDLGDSALNHLYEASRYCLEAIQHPSGFSPMGTLPYQWQGAMFWDATFAAEAWMSMGDHVRARRIAKHLLGRIEESHVLAARLGRKGARIEWTLGLTQPDEYDPPTLQVHNQAAWARCLLRIASETDQAVDESPLLPQAVVAAESLLECLASYVFVADEQDKGFRLAALSGIDESTTNLKIADTWTLASFIAAIRELREACHGMGRCPRLSQLDEWERLLEQALNDNIDANGVLQSFRGGRRPHWGSLVFDLLPEHPAREATLNRMAEVWDPVLETVNYHAIMHYPERTFPWTTLWVARIRARHADPRAMDLVREGARFCNSHGALPERVFYHGERYVHWMVSAHAAYLWAVNTALAFAPDSQTLRLFGGVDGDDTLAQSCQRVHAGFGLVVSARRHGPCLRDLTIHNRGPARVLTLLIHQQTAGQALKLEVGENRLCDHGRWLVRANETLRSPS